VATTPEGKAKAAIKAFLKSLPDCWFFMPVGGAFSVAGIPDIVAVIRGRFVAIECKAPGKESNTTPHQDLALFGIHDAGGLAFVASSVDTVKVHLTMAGLYVP
jgi:hypothetical protein